MANINNYPALQLNELHGKAYINLDILEWSDTSYADQTLNAPLIFAYGNEQNTLENNLGYYALNIALDSQGKIFQIFCYSLSGNGIGFTVYDNSQWYGNDSYIIDDNYVDLDAMIKNELNNMNILPSYNIYLVLGQVSFDESLLKMFNENFVGEVYTPEIAKPIDELIIGVPPLYIYDTLLINKKIFELHHSNTFWNCSLVHASIFTDVNQTDFVIQLSTDENGKVSNIYSSLFHTNITENSEESTEHPGFIDIKNHINSEYIEGRINVFTSYVYTDYTQAMFADCFVGHAIQRHLFEPESSSSIHEAEGTLENPVILFDLPIGYNLVTGYFKESSAHTKICRVLNFNANKTGTCLMYVGAIDSINNNDAFRRSITCFGSNVIDYPSLILLQGTHDVVISNFIIYNTPSYSSAITKLNINEISRPYEGWSDWQRFLSVDNSLEYTPTRPYHPATKVFVETTVANSPTVLELENPREQTEEQYINKLAVSTDPTDPNFYYFKRGEKNTAWSPAEHFNTDEETCSYKYKDLYLYTDILNNPPPELMGIWGGMNLFDFHIAKNDESFSNGGYVSIDLEDGITKRIYLAHNNIYDVDMYPETNGWNPQFIETTPENYLSIKETTLKMWGISENLSDYYIKFTYFPFIAYSAVYYLKESYTATPIILNASSGSSPTIPTPPSGTTTTPSTPSVVECMLQAYDGKKGVALSIGNTKPFEPKELYDPTTVKFVEEKILYAKNYADSKFNDLRTDSENKINHIKSYVVSEQEKTKLLIDKLAYQKDTTQEVLKAIQYMPQVYTQKDMYKDSYGNEKPGYIKIKYPYETVPNNSLLFVLPLRGSIEHNAEGSQFNRLVVEYWEASTVNGEEVITKGKEKIYEILVEQPDGTKRNATVGDILPDRLCVFRFIKGNANYVILCNNPIHGDIYASSLKITGEVSFYQTPTVNGVKLASLAELQSLNERIERLENKFKSGSESAEAFFDNNPDLPEGTIYIQTEE